MTAAITEKRLFLPIAPLLLLLHSTVVSFEEIGSFQGHILSFHAALVLSVSCPRTMIFLFYEYHG